mmetsp:Transcript_5570/g.8783  ORF Transcript_5570/g.8783 Transcript_5570/m.8783 type:complete len:156 (-) Transcript_5570:277-744(-)
MVCLVEEVEENLNKLVVGFISDIVGPVQMPLYSVALYKQSLDEIRAHIEKEGGDQSNIKEFFIGRKLGLVSKHLKTLNSKLPQIMAQKGCDASNVYDEEVGQNHQEFSDDEEERAHKKAKKKRGKNRNGELEEGEIVDDDDNRAKKKRKPNPNRP